MPAIAQAIEEFARKRLLPTHLGASQLQRLASDVRAASLFSARTTEYRYLAEIKRVVSDILDGKINEATGRMELKDILGQLHFGQSPDALPFDPISGFPGDAGRGIPPASPGSLQDLSSDSRLRLVLETQTRLAQNAGMKLRGMEPDTLHDYPAWELVRIYDRENPRDESKNEEDHWPERFEAAGGEIVQGRLIALKTDEVWKELGDSELFDDGLDSETPPYWFNSGGGWREVPRSECVGLGLIGENEEQESDDVTMFDESNFEGHDMSGLSDGDMARILHGLRA